MTTELFKNLANNVSRILVEKAADYNHELWSESTKVYK